MEYLCYLQSIFKGTYTVLRLLTTYLRFVRVSIKSKDDKIKKKKKKEEHEKEREKKREAVCCVHPFTCFVSLIKQIFTVTLTEKYDCVTIVRILPSV